MRKKLASLCLCLVFIVVAQCRLCAQNYLYATGNPTFSTQVPIENGFINVNNGDIHIEIPLAQHTQRGSHQLNERLVYDSRIWKIINSNGYSWQPTNVPNSMGGWRFASGLDQGTTSFSSSQFTWYDCAGNPFLGTAYWAFTWTDPEGTAHMFIAQTTHKPAPPEKCYNPPDTPSGSSYAVDGSGYLAVISNYTQMTVYDQSGVVVYGAVQLSDPNGNYWSADSNGNLIDTVGRTPVKVSTNGNLIYYDVLGVGGVTNRYTVTTETVQYSTNFKQQAVTDVTGTFTAIQSIELPDTSTYSFTYDSGKNIGGNYGELTGVTLPTGGSITYGYKKFLDSFQNQNQWLYTRTKDGGTTTFTPSTISQCSSTAGCQEKVTVTSPAGNDTVYTFALDEGSLSNSGSWNTNIDAWQGSSTSGGSKLKSVTTSYAYAAAYFNNNNNNSFNNLNMYEYPTAITTNTTLDDAQETTQQITTLSSLGFLPTDVKTWDYYPSSSTPSSSPLQDRVVSYESAYPNPDPGLYPQVITLNDGGGNTVSQTTYIYDQYPSTPSGGLGPLVATSGLPQHATASGKRWNLTTVQRWLNTTGTTLNTTATYNDAGDRLTSTDPNGTTTYSYDADDAFVVSLTLPTPSSGVSLSGETNYDASTGAITSTSDPNARTVTYKTFDSFNRFQEVDNPDGGITAIAYTPTSISTSASNSSTGWTIQAMDTYGRANRLNTATGVSSNPWYMQDTCYNPTGQVSFRSYRFQGQFSAAPVCSGAGDSYVYDALGRVTRITHGDGTAIKHSYTGRATKTVDENGVGRIVQLDVFGRTTIVCELSTNSTMPGSGSPGACGTDISGTGFVTNYAYNDSTHTTTITQGVQTRTLQTDSLGRNILAQEPERGTTTYSYTYNSTGLSVVRQRPKANQTNANTLTSTTTQYDAVDRPISITYTDGTPTKYFDYDVQGGWAQTQANIKGRLTKASSAVAGNLAATIYSYDQMGRVAFTGQCQPSGCYNGSKDKYSDYTWDYAGNMLTAGDGAGTTNSYSYTPAAEVTTITSSQNDATHPGTLVSSVSNGPFGPSLFTYGNKLNSVNAFDGLGRQTGSWVCSGSSLNGCSQGTQLYGYSITPQGSRVNQACDSLLGPCTTLGYDDFNRLTSRTTTGGTSLNNSWSYDRYGNRWTEAGTGSNYNTSNNQEVGFLYDAAGNVTSDKVQGIGHTYAYDAEGNVTSVDGGQTATYYYDALNQRVRSVIGSNSYEYVFNLNARRTSIWNGSSGTLLAENEYWGASPLAFVENNAVHFQHVDWLGTERITTSYSGATEGSYSSLPFGDGFVVNGADQDPYHFAVLDHDYESGQDHAEFREYSAAQGRWNSPDPYDGSYDLTNPQSFNRYSYVGNNPLSATDPTGMVTCASCGDGGGGGIAGIIIAGITLGLDELFSLFDGPSFHGSLHPRPSSPDGDPYCGSSQGCLNESLGLPGGAKIGPNIAGALGLPDASCEFGACGGGPTSFSGGADPSTKITSLWENIQEHLGKIAENPENQQLIDHWTGEIQGWASQISKTARKVTQGRRPGAYEKYLERLGIFGSDLDNFLPSPIIMVNPCITNPFAPYCSKPYNGPA